MANNKSSPAHARKKRSYLSFGDTVKLLEPLIDFSFCHDVSIRQLSKNRRDIIRRLHETRQPALLRMDNVTLLLCDPQGYLELENRRRWLLANCPTEEEILRVEKIAVQDPRLQKLATLKWKIGLAKKELADAKCAHKKAGRQLAELKSKVKAVLISLRRKSSGGGSSGSLI